MCWNRAGSRISTDFSPPRPFRPAESILKDRHPETLAAQHQPDHPQLPILEPVDLRMRPAVEIHQRPGRDQLLAGASSCVENRKGMFDTCSASALMARYTHTTCW